MFISFHHPLFEQRTKIVGRLRWKEIYISNKMTSTLMRVRKIREKGEGNNGRERDGYFGNSRLVVRYV